MLRKIRVILALFLFSCITLLFLDITGALHTWLGWTARIQFLPAALAMNTGIVLVLLAVTALSGRIYCSTICPLGVFQDMVSWLRGRIRKKDRFRFGYKPERKWLRYLSLCIFLLLIVLGAGSIAYLIEPYSAFGRIASSIFAPIYRAGNNLLSYLAEELDSYLIYETEVWISTIPVLIAAVLTLITITLLAWTGGRTWCNSICPVGTILGLFSRRSIFRPVIDTSKCRDCGLCGKQCKSSCIDMNTHTIDYSRCVVCMDCIETCKDGAISFTAETSGRNPAPKSDAEGNGRRAFMATSAALITASALKPESLIGKGTGTYPKAGEPVRSTPLVPAGSGSLKNFTDHCVACQLCVSSCPNGVLRPSSSLSSFMIPQMGFEKGYCRPECTECSSVCPAGAIRPISIEEKSSIQIGRAVTDLSLCVVNTDGVSCGNCARHCPSGAIIMVRKNPDDENSLKIPTVNEEKCIGCGACENLCPARPLTAIHVEGNEIHHTI